MSRWAKEYPYLYMPIEELRAIPNEELKALVKKFWNCENWADQTDCWQRQSLRLCNEKSRREYEGLMEAPASWKKNEEKQEIKDGE